MKTIYCFNNGGSYGWMHAVAIDEDGLVVAGHICSDEGYMQHDLGLTSTWKHEIYNKQYGEGNWKLEWVETDKIETHEGLNKAFELNKKLENPVVEDNQPSIKATFSE